MIASNFSSSTPWPAGTPLPSSATLSTITRTDSEISAKSATIANSFASHFGSKAPITGALCSDAENALISR